MGTLDELFPGLRDPERVQALKDRAALAQSPEGALHPRVLDLSGTSETGDAGEPVRVLIAWRDPGGARALFERLKPSIEATLLADLSCPPELLRDDPRPFEQLLFVQYAPIDDVEAALAPFGLSPLSVDARSSDPALRTALALVRHEAQVCGLGELDDPVGVFGVTVKTTHHAAALEQELAQTVGKEPWGEAPGEMARALASAYDAVGLGKLAPTLLGLRNLEKVILPTGHGVIRGIGPFLFQALCDLCGAIASTELDRHVDWAVCEPDEEGVAQPPLLRVSTDGGHAHIPIGLELMRWCMMPRRKGEDIPPFADWLKGAIG